MHEPKQLTRRGARVHLSDVEEVRDALASVRARTLALIEPVSDAALTAHVSEVGSSDPPSDLQRSATGVGSLR